MFCGLWSTLSASLNFDHHGAVADSRQMSHSEQCSPLKTTSYLPSCHLAAKHASDFLENWLPECSSCISHHGFHQHHLLITSNDRCRHPSDLLFFTLHTHEDEALTMGLERCSFHQHGARTASHLHKSWPPQVGPANHRAVRQAALQGQPHIHTRHSHAFVLSLHNGIVVLCDPKTHFHCVATSTARKRPNDR